MKNISCWVKIVTCICALAAFVSTQLVKQHYMADIFGGVLLAELGVFRTQKRNQTVFQKGFTKINKNLLRIEQYKRESVYCNRGEDNEKICKIYY